MGEENISANGDIPVLYTEYTVQYTYIRDKMQCYGAGAALFVSTYILYSRSVMKMMS